MVDSKDLRTPKEQGALHAPISMPEDQLPPNIKPMQRPQALGGAFKPLKFMCEVLSESGRPRSR